jgi:hypothetical protein
MERNLRRKGGLAHCVSFVLSYSLFDPCAISQECHIRNLHMKKNCWEFKGCGRELNGVKSRELGVCPAATELRLNGTNSGKNGGRACWGIAGTLCGGKVQGAFAAKVTSCLACDFYQTVGREEGVNHESAKEILAKLCRA